MSDPNNFMTLTYLHMLSKAAKNLRNAQIKYLSNKTEENGNFVGEMAEKLDICLRTVDRMYFKNDIKRLVKNLYFIAKQRSDINSHTEAKNEILKWFITPNQCLEFQSPLNLIKDGKIKKVHNHVLRLISMIN